MHLRWSHVKESDNWAFPLQVKTITKSIERLTDLEYNHELYEFLAADWNTPCGAELQIHLVISVVLVGQEKCHRIEVEHTMRVTNGDFTPPHGAHEHVLSPALIDGTLMNMLREFEES